MRDNAGIGALPSLLMHVGDGASVAWFCLPDVDAQRIHDLLTINPHRPFARVEANSPTAFSQPTMTLVTSGQSRLENARSRGGQTVVRVAFTGFSDLDQMVVQLIGIARRDRKMLSQQRADLLDRLDEAVGEPVVAGMLCQVADNAIPDMLADFAVDA